ncbi:MAG: hypothetical protein GY930_06285 [bacterium]|nr:hypothetical protein [bacterium]
MLGSTWFWLAWAWAFPSWPWDNGVALTLQNQNAQDYALGTSTDKGRIITFYRGHW